MLELNDVKGVEIGIEMDQVKTFTLPHSMVNTSSLSYREAEDGAKSALLPKYFVYVEDDGSSLDNIEKTDDKTNLVELKVLTGVQNPEEDFAEDSSVWENANNLESGKVSILKITGSNVHFGDEEESSPASESDGKIVIAIPTGADVFALTSVSINSVDATDPDHPVETPVAGSPFTFPAQSVDNITLSISKNEQDEWVIKKDGVATPTVSLDIDETYVLSVNGSNIEITSDSDRNGTVNFKPVLSESITKTEDIVKVAFGLDGKNKSHTVTPATLTKTNKFINGLKIAIKYCVDEIVFVTLGTLTPSTGEIKVNGMILPDYIDSADEESENTRLLKVIEGWGSTHINNVQCLTINKSEKSFVVINWNTDESELKELHPLDADGNVIENITPGSVIVSISAEDPYDAEKDMSHQDEGVIILSDHAAKEVIDEDGFVHLVMDEDTVTSNGVLNRFRSVEFTKEGDSDPLIYFEKEAYSVGKVYYNTGVVELKDAVPVVAGTAPALYCNSVGMDNLKFNVKNKGTDGNKYSLKLIKDHTENNGDVIYNVVLMLNDVELDSVTCSSNPDGSTISGTDAAGNVVDVEVPYIGTLDHDTFSASFTNSDTDTLKSLHVMTYNFSGGTDGVDGITASDYIGYKDESGTAGAWLFDDVKYPAQMWPSLGYTDKEFYMAAQDIAWNRKDTTCVWDIPKGYSKKTAIEYREEEPIPSQWWTELYYNWCNDVYNGAIVELPPSYYVTKNSLASYKLNGTWYPVAGKERGTIDAASVINQVPAKLDRDEFITHNINPIYDTGNQGIQIYGNETLNAQYTDLSAAHIARTLTYIRSKVDAYTETLKFELNDVVLWRTWIDYVKNKILETIKAARGLQWYRVSMGNDTTTAEELANRIVRGIVELQFVPDAEIYKLDYVVYSSAADNSTF